MCVSKCALKYEISHSIETNVCSCSWFPLYMSHIDLMLFNYYLIMKIIIFLQNKVDVFLHWTPCSQLLLFCFPWSSACFIYLYIMLVFEFNSHEYSTYTVNCKMPVIKWFSPDRHGCSYSRNQHVPMCLRPKHVSAFVGDFISPNRTILQQNKCGPIEGLLYIYQYSIDVCFHRGL